MDYPTAAIRIAEIAADAYKYKALIECVENGIIATAFAIIVIIIIKETSK